MSFVLCGLLTPSTYLTHLRGPLSLLSPGICSQMLRAAQSRLILSHDVSGVSSGEGFISDIGLAVHIGSVKGSLWT